MNYEKKYKEALEKARQFSERPLEKDSSSIVEYIFPELTESEDERIRNYLLKLADRCPEDSIDFMGEVKKGDIIAWLEKQGEKKSSDEVLKIRQEVYQSGYNDGYKHGIEDGKQGEQKSHAWSKEDERAIGIINLALEHPYNMEGKWDRKFALDWLKSLKQRIGG